MALLLGVFASTGCAHMVGRSMDAVSERVPSIARGAARGVAGELNNASYEAAMGVLEAAGFRMDKQDRLAAGLEQVAQRMSAAALGQVQGQSGALSAVAKAIADSFVTSLFAEATGEVDSLGDPLSRMVESIVRSALVELQDAGADAAAPIIDAALIRIADAAVHVADEASLRASYNVRTTLVEPTLVDVDRMIQRAADRFASTTERVVAESVRGLRQAIWIGSFGLLGAVSALGLTLRSKRSVEQRRGEEADALVALATAIKFRFDSVGVGAEGESTHGDEAASDAGGDTVSAAKRQVMQDLMSDIQKLMPRITGGEKPETALERLLKESRKDLLIRASDFRRPPQGTRPRTGGEE